MRGHKTDIKAIVMCAWHLHTLKGHGTVCVIVCAKDCYIFHCRGLEIQHRDL